METLPLRVPPDVDLRKALEQVLEERRCAAAFVVAGIGSLRGAALRMAGAEDATTVEGDLEILTLSGTIAVDGAHLHMTVSKQDGRVLGGHAAYGCIVRTTAEVLVLLLPNWSFTRERDPATGYPELVVRPAR